MSDSFWSQYPEEWQYFTISEKGMKALHTEKPYYHAPSGRWIDAMPDPYWVADPTNNRPPPLISNGGRRMELGITDNTGRNAAMELQKRPPKVVSVPAEPEKVKTVTITTGKAPEKTADVTVNQVYEGSVVDQLFEVLEARKKGSPAVIVKSDRDFTVIDLLHLVSRILHAERARDGRLYDDLLMQLDDRLKSIVDCEHG